MRQKKNSVIRRLGLQSCLIAVIAITAVLAGSIYNIILFNRETKAGNRYLIESFAADVETELEGAGLLLSNMVVKYAVMLQQEDSDRRYFIKNEILDQMNFITPTMQYVDGYFYASPLDEAFLFCMNPSVDPYRIPEPIRQYVGVYQEREENSCIWKLVLIDKKPYLFYSNIYNNVYYGAWCDVGRLLLKASEGLPEGTIVSASDTGGMAVAVLGREAEWQENKKQPYLLSAGTCLPENSLDGLYLEVGSQAFWLSYLRFSAVLIIISLGGILLLLLNLWWTQKKMVEPVGKIVEAFGKVRKGELETRLAPERYSMEFQEISRAFNETVSEISRLKIEQYTQQISRQNVELQYYQMQLEPHFYLNTINTIYSMAQIGECEAIRKISRYFSNYIRYRFANRDAYETVGSALAQIQNYLQLQRLRNAAEIECVADIRPELLEIKIPFLLLHTFVENSVKYGQKEEGTLKIQIVGILSEDGNRIVFEMRDNGLGYGSELLNQIAQGSYWEKEKSRIGILNVYKRMQLLYSEHFGLQFWNDSGACARIWLPAERRKE